MNNEQDGSLKRFFIPFTTTKAVHFLIVIGIIIFFNGLFNNFVADDPPEITENIIIHSMQNIPQFFTGSLFYSGEGQKLGGSFYRPLQSVLFSVIYSSVGPNYFVFHCMQIIFVIINTCMVFFFLKHFVSRGNAFFLSLIFLIHPINSEVAYYISATQEVLFLFFGMVALLILKKYQSNKAMVIATISLFCSLLSKETGILFFFISLLYIFLYKRKSFFYLLGYSSSILCIYFFLRISAIGIVANVTKNAPIQNLSFIDRMKNVPEIFLFYLKTFFFPLNLAVLHHWVYTKIDFSHFFLPLGIDLLFLAGAVSIVFFLYKKKSQKYLKEYVFFLSWFLLGMLLHLQIIPLDQTVAEQWFYFPMIGFLGMIGITEEAVYIQGKNVWVLSLGIGIVLLFSFRTVTRSFDWRDDFTLANHDIHISKEAYPLEHQLSKIYFDRGEYEKAKIHAEKSIRLYPYVFNYTDLGNAEFFLKQYQQAAKAYREARKYGDFYVTYDNESALGIDYGDTKENIDFIKNSALKKYPYDARLWLYLAVLDYRVGNTDSAKREIQNAYKLNTGVPEINPIYLTIMNDKPLHFTVGK